jgi:hypothetical protein
MTQRKTIAHRLILGLVAIGLIASPLQAPVALGQSAPAGVTVAPNLMVILGNSYSMNREMDNQTYPRGPLGPIQTQCPAAYGSQPYTPAPSFANDPGCGGAGTPFGDHLYGNQPTSKLYIAKQVLYNLLSSQSSANINFGFATFRQAFGLENSVATALTNAFWPFVLPPGGTPSNLTGNWTGQTQSQLTSKGTDPNNFAYVNWWPGWDNWNSHSFYLGAGQPDNAANVVTSTFSGGLPKAVQYPAGTISNQTYGQFYYGSGGLDTVSPINASPTDPEPKFSLCRTYYNSQANGFQGEYVASNPDGSPRMVINTYPTLYNGNTINFISLSNIQYDAAGQQNMAAWTDTCYDGSTRQIKQSMGRVSNQFKAVPGIPSTNQTGQNEGSHTDTSGASALTTPAYFNYIPNVWSGTDTLGVPKGTFTGWSGAASYNPTTNSFTASYPAGPQSASAMGSYNKSGAPYMGVFVDLPNPAAGYIDQRALLRNLVNPAYPQMSDSGLGYDPNTQTITDPTTGTQRSISASDYKPDYEPYQEPVYASLMDAAAYYAAYKKKDPNDGCRTNAVLLIYDGHEDAWYTKNPDGTVTYADPTKAAAALLAENVKTYVVIISSDPGDIAQANAIAQAGGTSQAYTVQNANDLSAAIGAVFTSLQGSVVAAAPAVPGYVQNGTLAYALASNNAYGSAQGFLYAFSTDATGSVSASPAWQLTMTAAQRQGALYTDSGNGSTPTLFANTPGSAFQSTNPTPSTIINYTIDPSYGGGQYLAGRQNGSFLGTITSQADKPVILSRPNNPYFLTNSGYQNYAKANAGRQPLVLFTANDGFLYAVSAGTASTPGTLQWGWMPSTLLSQLKNYSNFQSSVPMNGGLTTADSADANGNWATYVVGTAQSGALHYALKLTPCASGSSCTPTIAKVFLDNQAGATSTPSAAPQAPVIWWDSNGIAYAYYFTTSGGRSYLNSMRLYDGKTSQLRLGFTPSSTAMVDVQGGKLYVGDTGGNLWSFDLTAGPAATSLQATAVGTVANAATAGPVRYVGIGQTQNGYYLWATTDHAVNVFKFTGGAVPSSTTGWTLWWWSATNGSGVFNGSTMTTTTSDPGLTSTPAPYWIDANGTITDASAIVNNTLIVPVTVGNATNVCAATTAKYDFFDLDKGIFPQHRFYLLNGQALTSNPIVGYGTAYSPVLSQNQSGSGLVYGSAQQNLQQKVGFQVAATTGIHVGAGVMGWQPLWMTQP